jgi:hypothetical protein
MSTHDIEQWRIPPRVADIVPSKINDVRPKEIWLNTNCSNTQSVMVVVNVITKYEMKDDWVDTKGMREDEVQIDTYISDLKFQ